MNSIADKSGDSGSYWITETHLYTNTVFQPDITLDTVFVCLYKDTITTAAWKPLLK